jgi:hypothetical protein
MLPIAFRLRSALHSVPAFRVLDGRAFTRNSFLNGRFVA